MLFWTVNCQSIFLFFWGECDFFIENIFDIIIILNSTCYFVRNFLKRRLGLLYLSLRINFYEELSELSSEELLCRQLSSLKPDGVSDESVSLS